MLPTSFKKKHQERKQSLNTTDNSNTIYETVKKPSENAHLQMQ